MEVSSGRNQWLIPPHYALWIPALIHHQIRMRGAVSMRTLYLRASLNARSESDCAVLHIGPLLRELIVEIVRVGQLGMKHRYEIALRELLVPQIRKASSAPILITVPRQPRALAVARAILQNPAEPTSLAVLCSQAGVSVRTIERIFRKDIGSSFETWRRQVRLMKAVELLTSGDSVKEVAFKVGYNHSSAFIEMFRQTFGTPPKAWVTALELQGRR